MRLALEMQVRAPHDMDGGFGCHGWECPENSCCQKKVWNRVLVHTTLQDSGQQRTKGKPYPRFGGNVNSIDTWSRWSCLEFGFDLWPLMKSHSYYIALHAFCSLFTWLHVFQNNTFLSVFKTTSWVAFLPSFQLMKFMVFENYVD